MRLLKEDLYRCRVPLLIIALWCILTQWLFGTVCPFRLLFHIDCPGCGLTRGCLCILTLRWQRAWGFNPASFLWLPLLACLLIFRYILKKDIRWGFPAAVIAGIVTLIQWAVRLPSILQTFTR